MDLSGNSGVFGSPTVCFGIIEPRNLVCRRSLQILEGYILICLLEIDRHHAASADPAVLRLRHADSKRCGDGCVYGIAAGFEDLDAGPGRIFAETGYAATYADSALTEFIAFHYREISFSYGRKTATCH